MNLFKKLKSRLSKPEGNADLVKSLPLILAAVRVDIRNKNYADARRRLLEVLDHRDQLHDPVPIAHVLGFLSQTWLYADQYHEAVEYFTSYIARYPGDSTAYEDRAACLWYSGETEAAINDYSRALELSPTSILALAGRGQVVAGRGEHESALRDLNLALDYMRQNCSRSFCCACRMPRSNHSSKLPVTPWKPWRACLKSHFITRMVS
jgi:tetratricopeptide (TPR) repeat protein